MLQSGTGRKTLLEQNLWWTNALLMIRTPRSTWPACSTRRAGTARQNPNTNTNSAIRYSEALAKFSAAQQMIGYDAHLSYNTALCHYRLKDFAPALKNIADIIERGIREHPELSVGMQTEGIEVRHID